MYQGSFQRASYEHSEVMMRRAVMPSERKEMESIISFPVFAHCMENVPRARLPPSPDWEAFRLQRKS